MSNLSGIRDVDREILSKIDDKELIKVCSIDKYTWNIVCDDAFLRRRMLGKYSEIEKYKKEGESWKQFFLRSLYYIALLKEKFDYGYEYGNFQTQLEIFEENKENETSIYEARILVQSSV